jgi:hypothetical protein
MSDSTSPAPVAAPAPAKVSFNLDDAVKIVTALGTAASAINPLAGPAVATITGIIELIRDTVIPAIQHAHDNELSVAQQQLLIANSALERAKVGAPPADSN